MKKADIENKSGTISLSFGNKKLVSSNETKFIIWSIPAVTTCPFATEECKKLVTQEKLKKHIRIASRQEIKILRFQNRIFS